MIEEYKYKIPKFEEFRKIYNFRDKTELKFATHIAIVYHEFAYHQMMSFLETNNEFFEKNLSENDPAINTYLNKAWSNAYSVYALLRTTIEATGKINEKLLEVRDIGNTYKERIKEIVDIANNVVKHPMFNNSVNSSACLPASLTRGGGIGIQKWVGKIAPSSTMEIDPEKDFHTICGYLENVAELGLQERDSHHSFSESVFRWKVWYISVK